MKSFATPNSFRFVFFLLGDSLASELFVPMFWNTLFHVHTSCILFARPMKMEEGVPKRRLIKFSRRRITQMKEHNIHNTAKIGNQEFQIFTSVLTYPLLYMQEIIIDCCGNKHDRYRVTYNGLWILSSGQSFGKCICLHPQMQTRRCTC